MKGVVNVRHGKAAALGARFRRYRDELALSPGLDFHSLRRSSVTHLIEDGYDALFVQRQDGQEYASSVGLCASVSSPAISSTSASVSLSRIAFKNPARLVDLSFGRTIAA
jgi:hypothetical protein